MILHQENVYYLKNQHTMLCLNSMPALLDILQQTDVVLLWEYTHVVNIGWIQDIICLVVCVLEIMMEDGYVLVDIHTMVDRNAIVKNRNSHTMCVLQMKY